MSSMHRLLEALITVAVGLVLFPVISSFTTTAQVNASSATSAILSLVPIFWVFGILALAAGLVYIGAKGK